MNCPIETQESAELLLAYCARKLDAESTAILERHIEICPACREFAHGQRTLWEALDTWEVSAVAADFDRRLYRRIEKEVSWWDLIMRPLHPLILRPGVPVAAAACLVVMVATLLQPPSAIPTATDVESAQVEAVQPDQVEHALDTMETLGEFSRHVRGDAADSKMKL